MDLSFFGTPLGITLIASSAALIGGLLGAWISSRTTRVTHRERVKADHDLAERRFTFERELAERKFKLDRGLADWKRRTDLAEEVLSDFYKARSIFGQARSPFAFAGEGKTRPRSGARANATRVFRGAGRIVMLTRAGLSWDSSTASE